MKLITLALMLFFLNLSAFLVNTAGVFPNYIFVAQSDWRDEVEGAKSGKFDPDVAADVTTSFGFGDFVTGFKQFVQIFFRITFVGEQLKLFGLEEKIANVMSLGGIIIYLLGIAQFISNRGTKSMQ